MVYAYNIQGYPLHPLKVWVNIMHPVKPGVLCRNQFYPLEPANYVIRMPLLRALELHKPTPVNRVDFI